MHYSSALIFSFTFYLDPQVQKKAFIENTVPLIISLKNLLEQKRSPVLKDLMTYLQVTYLCMMDCNGCAIPCSCVWQFFLNNFPQVTMQDYRNEVKVFFSGDEQLAAEVEFALKTAEKEGEMEKQMENCNLTGEPRNPFVQVRAHHGNW